MFVRKSIAVRISCFQFLQRLRLDFSLRKQWIEREEIPSLEIRFKFLDIVTCTFEKKRQNKMGYLITYNSSFIS